MTEAPILVEERRGAAVWLTLSRPGAANALSRALVRELGARLAAVPSTISSELRAVVLTGGSGRAFSAGADLKERLTMSRDDTRAFLDELGAVVDVLAALPVPTIAAINGAALGGGLELALACDVRLAAEAAELGLPEARLGIIPGAGGTQRLARVVGVARAKELILTGRRIDAATAREWGLVSRVMPAVELAAATERMVEEIAACGPLAVAEAMAAIDGGAALPLGEGLALERRRYEVVLASADRDEGLRAFAEKRPPVFQGR
jgi:methylglutaconyl-CoA hydratase